jgi:hypothetical protein
VPRSGRKETELGSLILKRANNSRLSGRWSDDDYDVLENGVVVGRIFKVPVPPQDRPWMWASGHNGEIRRAAHGYEPAHEAAIAALTVLSWTKELGPCVHVRAIDAVRRAAKRVQA